MRFLVFVIFIASCSSLDPNKPIRDPDSLSDFSEDGLETIGSDIGLRLQELRKSQLLVQANKMQDSFADKSSNSVKIKNPFVQDIKIVPEVKDLSKYSYIVNRHYPFPTYSATKKPSANSKYTSLDDLNIKKAFLYKGSILGTKEESSPELALAIMDLFKSRYLASNSKKSVPENFVEKFRSYTYVHPSDFKVITASNHRGILFDGETSYGWVIRTTPVFQKKNDAIVPLKKIAEVKKVYPQVNSTDDVYLQLSRQEPVKIHAFSKDKKYIQFSKKPELFVLANDIRVYDLAADSIAKNSSEHWIDVDRKSQIVTAYEGDTPVFATIVSTGKEQFITKVGIHRIQRMTKAKSMMGGRDEKYYELYDVPWVMHFYKGQAFHGAYWHNEFGKEFSRGCVALALSDAKWLYDWADRAYQRTKLFVRMRVR